jgi:hypothetical protein
MLVREQRHLDLRSHTVLILLAASLGHATTEVVKELFVFADAFNVDGVAAAKTGCHACAGAIG